MVSSVLSSRADGPNRKEADPSGGRENQGGAKSGSGEPVTSGPQLLWASRLHSPSGSPELHDCFILFVESPSRKIRHLPRLLHLSQCQLRPQPPRSRYLGSSSLSSPSTSVRGRAYWICLKYGPSLPVPTIWKSHILGGSPQPSAHSLCLLSALQLRRFFRCPLMWLICPKPCSLGLSESQMKPFSSPVGVLVPPFGHLCGSIPSIYPPTCSSRPAPLGSLSMRPRPAPGGRTPHPQYGSCSPERACPFLMSQNLLTLKPPLLHLSWI